jgi:two-component system LytT family sensor kinase
MKRKSIIEIIIHLIFWIITFYFFTNNSFLRFQSSDVYEEYFSLLLIFTVIYINYFYLIPVFFTKQKYLIYFSFLFTIIVIINSIEFLWIKDDVIKYTFNIEKASQRVALQWNFFGIFFRDTLFVAFFTMFKIYRDAIKSYKLLQEKTAIELEQYITRIEMVKSKVNTHFFFNTLNSIYALALNKSDKTPDVIINLSNLMEYVVAESENERVSLSKEIDFIRNYIALECVKYSAMNLKFVVMGDITQHLIPPMIFESFVNNAFKYTNINKNGFINILIDCKPGSIIFSCENEIDKLAKEKVKSTAKGLLNTRNRLNLHYKDKHLLEIKEEATLYSVILTLNQ